MQDSGAPALSSVLGSSPGARGLLGCAPALHMLRSPPAEACASSHPSPPPAGGAEECASLKIPALFAALLLRFFPWQTSESPEHTSGPFFLVTFSPPPRLWVRGWQRGEGYICHLPPPPEAHGDALALQSRKCRDLRQAGGPVVTHSHGREGCGPGLPRCRCSVSLVLASEAAMGCSVGLRKGRKEKGDRGDSGGVTLCYQWGAGPPLRPRHSRPSSHQGPGRKEPGHKLLGSTLLKKKI